MSVMVNKEVERTKAQVLLDVSKTRLLRNQLGQFSTPNDFAKEIVKSSSVYLKDKQTIDFLDPALGTGSFFSAFLQFFGHQVAGESFGFEIDKDVASVASTLWIPEGLNVLNADFTKSVDINKKFDFIICNPPYVRHHHIDSKDKDRYVEYVNKNFGIKISKLSGLYCYFLFYAHKYLSDNGISVWLIPNEFLDVNYGIAIKQYLLEKVELIRIHRFDPNKLKFSDALVSSTIVWFRKKKSEKNTFVDFTYGDSINHPAKLFTIESRYLKIKDKWSSVFHTGITPISETKSIKVRDLFDIKRGIATGKNDFFILTEEQIIKQNLPLNQFKSILPSPKFIQGNIIESDNNGFPILPFQQFVLDCKLSELEIKEKYIPLYDYIKQGEVDGVSSGYICKNRAPWYFQEKRNKPLFVCNYIGRENLTKAFRFILNKSEAIITNSYLGLYPNYTFNRLQKLEPELSLKILLYLNSISTEEFKNKGRVYGGGMYKLEPKELENIEIPLPEYLLANLSLVSELTLFEPSKKYNTHHHLSYSQR